MIYTLMRIDARFLVQLAFKHLLLLYNMEFDVRPNLKESFFNQSQKLKHIPIHKKDHLYVIPLLNRS